jgi:hypothetical protein
MSDLSDQLLDFKNVIFLKYGGHSFETAEAIIDRKIMEVQKTGVTFWGYGGVACHPTKQVQPFLEYNYSCGEKTFLVLTRINSNWNGSSSKATIYSHNGCTWAQSLVIMLLQDLNMH